MVVSSSTNAAGDAMDEAIISYLREQHGLVAGIRSAESLKIEAGSAIPLSEEFTADVRGRDISSGLPRSVPISTEELRVALSPVIADIVTMVQTTLQQAPPQLIADLMTNGIALVGGGSLLEGLDERLSASTKFNCYVAQDPLTAVAKGCAAALSEANTFRLISSKDSLRKLPE
jgi:rod shape-determining protein MreB